MCEALTQLIEDGRNEGRDEGISIKMKELIRKKLSKGKSISVIADELEATVGEIERFMEVM